ncbi:MAG: TIR domain-containing protein [Pseudomonadota bacterium]
MSSGTRQHQFVFVSHARTDKPKIKAIVDALISGDDPIKVWLDNPSVMGYSQAEIEASFIDLHGGGRWDDQINDALEASMCVLACASHSFTKRYHDDTDSKKGSVIRKEVTAGETGDKLVSCRIDDLPFGNLPGALSEAQTVDLHETPDKLSALVRDVRRKIKTVNERKEAGGLRSDAKLYLVDRTPQENAAKKSIEAASDGGVHALFVKAPQNECLDLFQERLREETSRISNHTRCVWQELHVEWPSLAASRDEFADAYLSNLASKLGARVSDLTANLSKPRQAPLAAVSFMSMSEWGRSRLQKDRLREWLALWRRLQEDTRELKAVPVLAVELPEAAPKWKTTPKVSDGGVSSLQILRDVRAVEKEAKRSDDYVPLRRLDTLHPVTHPDAVRWLKQCGYSESSKQWDELRSAIDGAFAQGRKRLKRIAMLTFKRRMDALVRDGTI